MKKQRWVQPVYKQKQILNLSLKMCYILDFKLLFTQQPDDAYFHDTLTHFPHIGTKLQLKKEFMQMCVKKKLCEKHNYAMKLKCTCS